MPKFQVVSEYQPSGDQPEAVAALAAGIESGLKEQVLLGVTDSPLLFVHSFLSSPVPGVLLCILQSDKWYVLETKGGGRIKSKGGTCHSARFL